MANDVSPLGIRVIAFPLEATEEDLNANSKVLVDTPLGTKKLDGDILGSLAPSIAEKFNKNKSYEEGDVVMHRGALRRFKGPHQGDWTDSDNDATDVVALIEEASTQYVVFPCSPEDLPDGDIIKSVVDAGLHPALKFTENSSITYLSLTANYTRNGTEFLVFASGPFYITASRARVDNSRSLSDWEWAPLCDANMRAAGLVNLAPSFKSRSGNNYTWEEGEVCVYDDGHLYVFIRDHEGPWNDGDVEETTLAEVLAMAGGNEKKKFVLLGTISGTCEYEFDGNTRNAQFSPSGNGNLATMAISTNASGLAGFKAGVKAKISGFMARSTKAAGLQTATVGAATLQFKLSAVDSNGATVQTYNDTYNVIVSAWNVMEFKAMELDIPDTLPSGATGFMLTLLSTSKFYVDDYNIQSAYVGQKVEPELLLEVECDKMVDVLTGTDIE